MSERLTPKEIERIRMRQAGSREAVGNIPVTWRELNCLLQTHDLVERLRNMQQQDITEEQRAEWLASWTTCSGPKMQRDMIAAAVRVVAGGDGNAAS